MVEKIKAKIIDHFAEIIVVGVVLFFGQIIPDQLREYLKNKFFDLLQIIYSLYSWMPRWGLVFFVFMLCLCVWKLMKTHKHKLAEKDERIQQLQNAVTMLHESLQNKNKPLPIIMKFNAKWNLNDADVIPLCLCHSQPLEFHSNIDGNAYMLCKVDTNPKHYHLKRDDGKGITLADAKAEIEKIKVTELSKKVNTVGAEP